MEWYTGIDLHSNNAYVGICDREDRRVYQRRLPNMADVILAELEPYKEKMTGVVVGSTYNWYWLVDSLADHGYRVHLANPAAIQQYKGLKYAGDRHDAFWLAHLLRLGILPEGYILPQGAAVGQGFTAQARPSGPSADRGGPGSSDRMANHD